MAKIKLVQYKDELQDVVYKIGNWDGGNRDGNFIEFTSNVGPGGIEAATNVDELIEQVESEMRGYKFLLDDLKRIKKDWPDDYGQVDITTDFYWSEGDLLLKLAIPILHPMCQDLNLITEIS
jgi:hypothetical protein